VFVRSYNTAKDHYSDANGPVDRRESSSLIMSTCPITGTCDTRTQTTN